MARQQQDNVQKGDSLEPPTPDRRSLRETKKSGKNAKGRPVRNSRKNTQPIAKAQIANRRGRRGGDFDGEDSTVWGGLPNEKKKAGMLAATHSNRVQQKVKALKEKKNVKKGRKTRKNCSQRGQGSPAQITKSQNSRLATGTKESKGAEQQ